MTADNDNPLRIAVPYMSLTISGDDEGNAQRQAEADRINRTTNRVVDGREVVNHATQLLKIRNGTEPEA